MRKLWKISSFASRILNCDGSLASQVGVQDPPIVCKNQIAILVGYIIDVCLNKLSWSYTLKQLLTSLRPIYFVWFGICEFDKVVLLYASEFSFLSHANKELL